MIVRIGNCSDLFAVFFLTFYSENLLCKYNSKKRRQKGGKCAFLGHNFTGTLVRANELATCGQIITCNVSWLLPTLMQQSINSQSRKSQQSHKLSIFRSNKLPTQRQQALGIEMFVNTIMKKIIKGKFKSKRIWIFVTMRVVFYA